MANRNACSWKLTLFLIAFVVPLAHQSGFSNSQDIERLREAAVQGDACAQSILGLCRMNGRITHRSGRELKIRMHLFDDIFPVIRVEGRLLT